MLETQGRVIKGDKLGLLTVGDLVIDLYLHPLFEIMPRSYLRQGKVRECFCECGNIKLVSEHALSTGRVRSCGCLRRKILEDAAERKGKDQKAKELRKEKLAKLTAWREEKKANKLKIRELRNKMVTESIRWARDEKLIQALTTELRDIYARQAMLTVEIRRHRIRA